MIWLTWRQFRAPALILFAMLAMGVVALTVTGPQLADLLRDTGQTFFNALGADPVKRTVFYAGTGLVYALPAIVGVFWGAPMIAREVEAGTSRLVWTQSITRTRWLATKLGLTGACAALAGLLGLALTRWSAPLDQAIAKGYTQDNAPFSVPRLVPALFGARGTVPLGMALLALAIGVTIGLLLRRTVAAMAVTLVLVIAAQVVMPLVVQPHLLPQKQLLTTITSENLTEVQAGGPPGSTDVIIAKMEVAVDLPGAWVIQNRTVDGAGNVVSPFPAWVTACVPPPGQNGTPATREACFTRLEAEGYVQQIDYQPASRFWPLQLIETGILLGAALLLSGFCLWRVRRDLL
jgi:hypothetical protein